ncbi:diguanylate cyclase domain-containing protein [Ruminiclostridium hungatei]|uniref:diguanylate cyclase domain-containing protein n=1 Tax=Ruminiclostridium hungatei TaxID=48256 RepID=UPI0009AED5E0
MIRKNVQYWLIKFSMRVARTVQWGDATLGIRISIGIAFFPQDSIDPKVLIQYADNAMYAIKQRGGKEKPLCVP